MASQLAIEMTLESAEACIFSLNPESGGGSGSNPTYTLSNINLIPEILEFDASYGKSFIILNPNLAVFHAWREFSEGVTYSRLSDLLSARSRFLWFT